MNHINKKRTGPILGLMALCCYSYCDPVAAGWISSPFQPPHTGRAGTTFLPLVPQQLGAFERLTIIPTDQDRTIACLDYTSHQSSSSYIDFERAWELQKDLLQNHIDRLSRENTLQQTSFWTTQELRPGDDNNMQKRWAVDTLMLLEHQPVYTLGTGSDPSFFKNISSVAIPIIRMDRGGEVTYHGPGQLTVYPVLDLRNYKQDIHWYMRALEQVVLQALEQCGVQGALRDEETTGIWVKNRKVAAVGIKCKKWITQHGVAINVLESSLDNFAGIVPCGLEGRQVGCVNQFLDSPISVSTFASYVKEAFEDVFQVTLRE